MNISLVVLILKPSVGMSVSALEESYERRGKLEDVAFENGEREFIRKAGREIFLGSPTRRIERSVRDLKCRFFKVSAALGRNS